MFILVVILTAVSTVECVTGPKKQTYGCFDMYPNCELNCAQPNFHVKGMTLQSCSAECKKRSDCLSLNFYAYGGSCDLFPQTGRLTLEDSGKVKCQYGGNVCKSRATAYLQKNGNCDKGDTDSNTDGHVDASTKSYVVPTEETVTQRSNPPYTETVPTKPTIAAAEATVPPQATVQVTDATVITQTQRQTLATSPTTINQPATVIIVAETSESLTQPTYQPNTVATGSPKVEITETVVVPVSTTKLAQIPTEQTYPPIAETQATVKIITYPPTVEVAKTEQTYPPITEVPSVQPTTIGPPSVPPTFQTDSTISYVYETNPLPTANPTKSGKRANADSTAFPDLGITLIDNTQSSGNAQGTVCGSGEMVKFLRINGTYMIGLNDATFTATSEQQCLDVCKQNELPNGQKTPCSSANFNLKSLDCGINVNSLIPTGSGIPSETASAVYFEKLCIKGRLLDALGIRDVFQAKLVASDDVNNANQHQINRVIPARVLEISRKRQQRLRQFFSAQ